MTAPIVIGVDLSAVLTRLEQLMTTQAAAFAALSAKVDDIRADFSALIATLAAERENLTPAGQAALDELTAKVDALDVAVGDADGSDVPAPTTGVDDAPAVGDAEPPAGTPVDETPVDGTLIA